VALNDGRVDWQVDLSAPIYSALSYAPDLKYVYVGTKAGTVYALDADHGGKTVWSTQSNSDVSVSSPILDESRNVVYLTANEVTALDATSGDPDWITSFYGTSAGSTPVFNEDLVFAAGADGNVYALPRTGGTIRATPEWTFESRKTFVGDLALSDEQLVAVALDGTVFLLDSQTGDPSATATVSANVQASPRIVDSQLIVSATDGTIVAYG
jgi:outer membrane protein assembly factor BamB